MAEDRKENEMLTLSRIDYLRGLNGADSVLISLGDAILQGSMCKEFQIEGNTEYDTGIMNYGLYQLDNYNSGGVALYLVNYNGAKIVASFGSSFGAAISEGALSLYKKEGNGNIYIRNNLNDAILVGFRRV